MDENFVDTMLEELGSIVGYNAWLKATTAVNRKEERDKVLSSPAHNPRFEYPALDFEPKRVMD